MQRRPSAYKERRKSVGEGMVGADGAVSVEDKKRMLRRKSSVPENLYVYEVTVPDIEEGFDEIIYYKIVVKAIGNIEWTLFRRYSEFHDVHADISLELPTITFESPFPKKDNLSWLGPMRQKEIEKRRQKLNDWLEEFLSITNGSVKPQGALPDEITKMQDKLDAFLEIKEKIRAHTIAQAAKIEPKVDESKIAIFGEVDVPKVGPSLASVWNMKSFGGGEDDDNDEDGLNGLEDNDERKKSHDEQSES